MTFVFAMLLHLPDMKKQRAGGFPLCSYQPNVLLAATQVI